MLYKYKHSAIPHISAELNVERERNNSHGKCTKNRKTFGQSPVKENSIESESIPIELPFTYHVRPRFHAGHSLLGRSILRAVGDRHYAEGLLIIAIALLTILLLVAFYIGWAFVQPLVEADGSGKTALVYFLAQIGAFLLFFLVAIAGFKPALDITLEDDCLYIQQGQQKMLISTGNILSISSISALQFHRHYRKYRSTRAFFDRLNNEMLLIETAGGPVIIGISEEDQATLLDTLRSSATSEQPSSLAYVA